jgi:hypothetical protein
MLSSALIEVRDSFDARMSGRDASCVADEELELSPKFLGPGSASGF